MQRRNCLPEYIAIKQIDNYYKLYINFIYKSGHTYDIPANVLFPMENVKLNTITKFNITMEYNSTFIRKWNNIDYKSSLWSYTDTELQITYKGVVSTIPVISLDDYSVLPENQYSIPCPSNIQYSSERSKYNVGLLLSVDPYTVPVQAPVPVQRPVQAPVQRPVQAPAPVQRPIQAPAPVQRSVQAPVQRPVQALVPVQAPAPVQASAIPIHVKKLIITESIRNNEGCPITSEAITMENAAVTSCGHVFTKAAIQHWLSMASSNNLCPICKIRCSI